MDSASLAHPLMECLEEFWKDTLALMLNRHATSKINIQNAIKTQGQAGMIIRKCNHKHQTRLIARRRFLILWMLVSHSCHIKGTHEKITQKNEALINNLRHYLYFISSPVIISALTKLKISKLSALASKGENVEIHFFHYLVLKPRTDLLISFSVNWLVVRSIM